MFYVPGRAKTQGSKRPHFPRDKWGRLRYDARDNPTFIMVDSADWNTKALTHWKRAVAQTALVAATRRRFRRIPMPIGVTVQFRFLFPRPATIPEGQDHVTRPDTDKLERACIDAMAGIVYERDSQVCSKLSEKVYQRPHDPGPGVVVAITERRNVTP